MNGFGHVQEHRACEPLLAKIPGYSFNEAGKLQGRMSGSKSKLLVPQQPTLAYFI
jgi:hypothetical protein